MIDVYFTTTSKRKNSTLQPDFTSITPISCALKAPTTEEAPSFLLHWSGGAFLYNYCKWADHYYWVDGVTFERNDLLTVSCSLDVLATYKSYILASTQFVAYSSVSGGAWLPDRRIAVMANCSVQMTPANLSKIDTFGTYVLSVLGKNGCVLYAISKSNLETLLANVQDNNDDWIDDRMSEFIIGDGGLPEEWAADLGRTLKSFGKVLLQKDLLGNAYDNAVSCLRSCIWVPFDSSGSTGTSKTIYLGNYDTNVSAAPLSIPVTNETISISIPWQYSDWRRAYAEDIYLYLPLVGIVGIETSQITNVSSLLISAGYAFTDGQVAYEVKAGDHIIGTYGATCCAQYPLGINQSASAGQVLNAMVAGFEKACGNLTAGNLPSLASAGNLILAGYNVADTMYSTNPTVIGGIGGGAGSKLDIQVKCISVKHDTVVAPADMAATMGVPTQKPLLLSACSGYCQCINAHVAAPAHGDVLNAIDEIVNSGFYIE